jgi:hypothetical protein
MKKPQFKTEGITPSEIYSRISRGILVKVKTYATSESVETSAIYNRIARGKLTAIWFEGVRYVYPASDISIKKPRNQKRAI